MVFSLEMDIAEQIKKASNKNLSNYKVVDFKLTYFIGRESKHARFTTAFVAVVTQTTPEIDENQRSQRGVVLNYTQDENGADHMTIYCGDRYLSGIDGCCVSTTIDEYLPLIDEACNKVCLTKRESIKEDIVSLFGSWAYPKEGRDECDFYTSVRNSRGESLCDHTYALLQYVAQNSPNFHQELKQLYESAVIA